MCMQDSGQTSDYLQPELILSSMAQVLGSVPGFPARVDIHKSLHKLQHKDKGKRMHQAT